jgi:hypothetical protein
MLQTNPILGKDHRQDLGAIDPQMAWSAWEPTPEEPWDAKRVRHLMRRGGFGAKASEIQQLVDRQRVILIDRQAEDTVTIFDFRGGKVTVTREP